MVEEQKISACIIVKNEEDRIANCLESIKDLVDEIIIVDQHSEDRTVEVCQRYTDKIYQYEWDNSFANKRNYATSLATNEWVLSIDADQVVTNELSSEIKEALVNTSYDAYYVPRINNIFGKWMWREEHIWLYKKSKSKWVNRIHECNQIQGKIGRLSNHMLHYSSPTISSAIGGLDFYSNIHAQMFYEKDTHGASLIKVVYKPLTEFLRGCLKDRRIRDGGARGLIFSMLVSVYIFVVWAKYYELCYFKKENPDCTIEKKR